jgi:3-isopropylmalate/(R)-2-methylmalate dehydratase small subunit
MTELGRGRAWLFGAGITTDDILPGRYLDHGNHEVGKFAMAGVAPEFAGRVGRGDFIVAGPNFGAGSGRESAAYAIRGAGVAAVIAPSFGRLFFRNAINIGLPPIIVDTTEGIAEGDPLVVDLREHTIVNDRTRAVHAIRNLTGISLEILRAGGIVPYTLMRRRRGEEPRP